MLHTTIGATILRNFTFTMKNRNSAHFLKIAGDFDNVQGDETGRSVAMIKVILIQLFKSLPYTVFEKTHKSFFPRKKMRHLPNVNAKGPHIAFAHDMFKYATLIQS